MTETLADTGFTNTGWGVLAGVKVLDLTQMLSGPYCTMLLADHGADVIKIEPFGGETTRGNGPYLPQDTDCTLGGYFQSVNRNKRNLVVDLRSPEGREIILKLAAECDVVVSNFRHGVMGRLGLGFAALRAINPRLIYASVSGFGSPEFGESPYAEWPAYDVIAQAMGGIMSITGSDPETPTKVGPGIGDIFPGTLLAFAIVAALRRAERDGVGQQLEVAMYDAVVALCERAIYQYSYTGRSPMADGPNHPFLTPFGMFPAKDGWVALAAQNDNFWQVLCKVMGRDDLIYTAGFADKPARTGNRAEVNELVAGWTRLYTKAELKEMLGGKIPFGPVQTAAEILQDPHIKARDMVVAVEEPYSGASAMVANTPVKFSATQGGVRHRAPFLGEHTSKVLAGLGYSPEDVAGLKARRVVW
jgi:crotonobetainyl-CoA:carnitine CoA-transferase CaiB-like acyl-CoA transferase